jgi:nucleoside-diphosphate-sugar epimerase
MVTDRLGITGAAGYLGSILREALSLQYTVYTYDLKDIDKPVSGSSYRVDLSLQNEIDGLFNGIDTLIHLAGMSRPDAPEHKIYRNNIVATSNVFEECRRSGVRKIIYAGSCLYHERDLRLALEGKRKEKINLGMFPSPESLYAEAVVYAENIGYYLSNLGMEFISLRIGWVMPQERAFQYDSEYLRQTFISERDFIQIVKRTLSTETRFMTAYALSNNNAGIFDMKETRFKLVYVPNDDINRILQRQRVV